MTRRPFQRPAKRVFQWNRFVAVEYYADFGRIGDFLPLQEQQHQVFAATDFKAGVFDVELGAGYGLTAGSDRFVTKAIIGYAFPAPGGTSKSHDNALRVPLTTKSPSGHAAATAPGGHPRASTP